MGILKTMGGFFAKHHHVEEEDQDEDADARARRLREERKRRLRELRNLEKGEGIEDVFNAYASTKSWGGTPLMSGADWMRFFRDLQEMYPSKRPAAQAKLQSVFGEFLELQMDLCLEYNLQRGEAAKGLCLDAY